MFHCPLLTVISICRRLSFYLECIFASLISVLKRLTGTRGGPLVWPLTRREEGLFCILFTFITFVFHLSFLSCFFPPITSLVWVQKGEGVFVKHFESCLSVWLWMTSSLQRIESAAVRSFKLTPIKSSNSFDICRKRVKSCATNTFSASEHRRPFVRFT